MVRYCSVPGCKNNGFAENIRFHKFPKNAKLRTEWMVKLRIGKKISPWMIVCSVHFSEDCYDRRIPEYVYQRVPLKANAVPDKNLPTASFHKTVNSILSKARTLRVQKRREHKNSKGSPNNNGTCAFKLSGIAEAESETCDAIVDAETESCNAIVETENVTTDEVHKVHAIDKVSGHSDIFITPALVHTHKCSFVFSNLDGDITPLTGTSRNLFSVIVEQVKKIANPKNKMLCEDRCLLALMKLKLGLSTAALASIFQKSFSTVSDNIKSTIRELAQVMHSAIPWLDKESIVRCMPTCFQNYQSTRVVLDCTEVPVERPKCLTCRIRTYSNYKGMHTVKVLIGVAPSGVITFVSKVYGGRASDKVITQQSGILHKCIPYVDSVMVDKGFAIDDLCLQTSINLIRPPFLKGKLQFSMTESVSCASIARARVHVERSIGRIKQFKILQQKLNWELLPYVSDIFVLLCGLVNLGTPILTEEKFL